MRPSENKVNAKWFSERLQREVGISFVYVTHDQIEAMTMADRIVVMRDGWIEQIGELVLRGHGGTAVRLREVADIGPERTSNLIARENAPKDSA